MTRSLYNLVFMDNSDRARVRALRFSRFAASVRVREDNPATATTFRAAAKIGKSASGKKRGKAAASRAKAVALAFRLNGPGLYVDRYLRDFLTEYNGRIFSGEGMHMPNSYNVMHSFVEPDEKTLVLRLLPEKHFSLTFNKMLDRITDPHLSPSLRGLTRSLDEFTIYELSLLGGYAEFNVPGNEEFVFCGGAFSREGDELSVIGVFGRSNPNPHTGKMKFDAVDIYPGKEFLSKGKDEIDVTDEGLFGDAAFVPIILMTRIDTRNDKVQVRYVLKEQKDTFDVMTDDPQVAEFLIAKRDATPDVVENFVRKLDEYAPLFEILFASPLCLDLMDVDAVAMERHPTRLRLEAQSGEARFVKKNLPASDAPNYVQVATLYGLGTGDTFELPATDLSIETAGYWKTLSLGSAGRDRHGHVVQGKTWVTTQTSWFEGRAKLSDQAATTTIETAHDPAATGEIYVMRSPQHHRDLYKIGFTTKSSDERARQLSATTGQPDHFVVVQSWKVRSPRLIEQHVHDLLREHRVNGSREFFQCKFEKIRSTIEYVIERAAALIESP
ncbi:GIY-YIG nuclease family protein [Sphingomonas sp. RB3P16]|uniref:GIY-YIG nuclease family protein n=1 Tax=Parasphingomonas frigoris TaxID=3096163 RepID=UPI002FC6E0B3